MRRGGRRAATVMGVFFGVLMGLTFALALTWSAPWWAMLATFTISGLLQGCFFGFVMYLWVVKPAVEKQVSLRRAAGPLASIPGVDAGQCPSCRCEEFKVWTWRHPAMLHWMLNPGLAVNEIVLGQRVPSSVKHCKECAAQSVDCNQCHRAIGGTTWSGRAAFGQWTGLHCPHCDAPVPMLSNALGWVLRLPFTLVDRLVGAR